MTYLIEQIFETLNNSSIRRAAKLTQNMYEITYKLPESKHIKSKLLKMDEQQAKAHQIVQKYF